MIKENFGNRAQLLFTDTDSLMYHIETDDIYEAMADTQDEFDMSNYDPANKYYKPEFQQNKAIVGLMKDEAAGYPITEFVGLRPKMYSYTCMKLKPDGTPETSEKHRAKGIQRVAAAKLTHQQ